jgi:chemotaxis protein CheD
LNGWAGLPRLFLGVGEIACPPDPYWVTTILGSCVSLCLWDPVRRAGGINHAVLPRGGAGGRYGQAANAQLLEAMLEGGSERQDLRAKLFGGAAAIGTVGAQNVVAALEYLEAQRVPLLARRTGGNQGVLLHYRTDTGEVRLRRG